MKFMLSFLGLLTVTTFAVAEECSENELQKCSKGLLEIMNGEKEMDLNCEELREARDCLLQYVDRCVSDEQKEDAKRLLEKHVRNVKGDCPIEEQDTEVRRSIDDDRAITDEEKDCIEDKENFYAFVEQCYEQLIHFEIGLPTTGYNHDDNNCQSYLFFLRCIAKKTGEVCGERIEQVYFNDMVLSMRNKPKILAVQVCADAFKEAEKDDRIPLRTFQSR